MGSRNALIAVAGLAAILIVGAAFVLLSNDSDDDQTSTNTTPADTAAATSETTEAGETPEAESDASGAQADPTATQPQAGDPAPAPTPPAEDTFGFGESASEDIIAQFDIDIPPDGSGLPEGSGTPGDGEQVYAEECAACHGATGREGGLGPQLVSEPGPWEEGMPRTIGSYWPYATTLYDYTNRAMPFDEPGSLEPDEVYAVTAFLLWQNGIINEDEEMNAETLPQVEMPNQPQFSPCWPDECRFEDDSGS